MTALANAIRLEVMYQQHRLDRPWSWATQSRENYAQFAKLRYGITR